jgi:hypothetical protein
MGVKSRFTLSFLAVGLTCVSPQSAQARQVQKEAQSGKSTLLYTFFNCTSHRPSQQTAFVAHGMLTYRELTQNRCANADEPARQVWYTSNAGFVGADTVTFPGVNVIISVTVK